MRILLPKYWLKKRRFFFDFFFVSCYITLKKNELKKSFSPRRKVILKIKVYLNILVNIRGNAYIIE